MKKLILILLLLLACQKKEVVQTSGLKISLAQWSLHKTFFKALEEAKDSQQMGKLDPFNFPKISAEYGIYSIELVNSFYFDKAKDMDYWKKFKKNCDDAKVTVGLIMCDGLGPLASSDNEIRQTSIEKHYDWVDIAKFLGAHSIRVNLNGKGSADSLATNSVDALTKLAAYAAKKEINIIVENHGGNSSRASWLVDVMKRVDLPNVGTLPDFGNFCISWDKGECAEEYGKYKGVEEMMPFAKAVSAKTNVFDKEGNERKIDYKRMIDIVIAAGYSGYIGIEFEGNEISEHEGVIATKELLEKLLK